ncbi:MAG: uroporphyrinogen-III synthase [Gammaproteobacteria bacterium]|nr:uroporphyrinogen-III synthase [Gammaproteobacteria bacterium]
MADATLAGVGVLVTRPAHQAESLVRLIEQAGGVAIRFPAMAIAPPTDPQRLSLLLDRLAEFQFAIFISANAVQQAFAALRARGQVWPPAVRPICVGPTSARALAEHGLHDPLVPTERFDSEGVLALPALTNVAGVHVLIVRGEGGRELMAQTLRARGADVVYAECYRRVRPTADIAALVDCFRRDEIHIISITSSDGLNNLYEMIGAADRDLLLRSPIVVMSEAQASTARALGFQAALSIAPSASDAAILDAIRTWRTQQISL